MTYRINTPVSKKYTGIDLSLLIYLIDRVVLKHEENNTRAF